MRPAGRGTCSDRGRERVIETKVNYSLVGAFVLVLAAAAIAVVLWLASGGASHRQYDLYRAIEEKSVTGLNLHAPVKYNGVEVGKVRAITLDPQDPQRVRLTFAIEHGTPIKQDTVAVLNTQGPTGIAYVELGGGTRDSRPLLPSAQERCPESRTNSSLGARLENVLATEMTKLDRTTGNVDALLSPGNRAAFSSALADIAAVARTLAARQALIDAAHMNAARTADNSARATAKLGPAIDRIGRGADAVTTMSNEVARAGTSAAKTVTAVGSNAQRFTDQTLPRLQQLLAELDALSQSLRRLSERAQTDPAVLLRGQAPVPDGPGESTTGARPP